MAAIRAYLLDRKGLYELNGEQEVIYIRYQFAWANLCKGMSRQDVVLMLHKTYGVTERQAYQDVTDATDLFGDVSKATKEGIRNILYEYAVKAYQLAVNNKDVQGMNNAVKNLIKISGVDKEDADMPDFKRLEPSIYIQAMDERTQLIVQGMVEQSGTIDLTKIDIIEDEGAANKGGD